MQIANRSLAALGMTRLADENRSGAATVILSEAKDLYAAAPLWYPPPQNVIPKRSEGSSAARPALPEQNF